jgi:glycosyltransferase involved in cell wall biosynthesis
MNLASIHEPRPPAENSLDDHDLSSPTTSLISVVIPLYNEAQTVPLLVQRIQSALDPLGRTYEILLVNDGSGDDTGRAISRAAKTDQHVKGIHLRRNYGQTTALIAGFHHARGDVIVTLDGDLQNDPQDIPLLLAKLEEGYDAVSGWREDRKDDALRRNLPSVLANRLISAATGVRLHDFGCALKAYRREIIRHVHLYGEMHRFIAIYTILSGARLAEVPVRHHARLHGKSNYGLERSVKVLFDLLVVMFLQRYAQKPMYLFGWCGLFSLGASAVAAGGALYYKFFGGKSLIETPLPLVSGVLFLAAVLCVLMGLLAELSIRIYHESQDKPTYLISRAENVAPREGAY